MNELEKKVEEMRIEINLRKKIEDSFQDLYKQARSNDKVRTPPVDLQQEIANKAHH